MARPKLFSRESSRAKTDTVLTIKDAALFEKATIESLRSVQHRDRDGNVISKSKLVAARPTS